MEIDQIKLKYKLFNKIDLNFKDTLTKLCIIIVGVAPLAKTKMSELF